MKGEENKGCIQELKEEEEEVSEFERPGVMVGSLFSRAKGSFPFIPWQAEPPANLYVYIYVPQYTVGTSLRLRVRLVVSVLKNFYTPRRNPLLRVYTLLVFLLFLTPRVTLI